MGEVSSTDNACRCNKPGLRSAEAAKVILVLFGEILSGLLCGSIGERDDFSWMALATKSGADGLLFIEAWN